MGDNELGNVAFGLLLLMLGANLLGQGCSLLHQPRVVGEIVAGVLLGPTVLGRMTPGFTWDVFGSGTADAEAAILRFTYDFGLLLLMFVAGCSVRQMLSKDNRRATAWVLGVGTPLPFVIALVAGPMLPLERMTGSAGSQEGVLLVFAAAAAVTSVPVISKIFYDLGILHTRFASLQLGSAVLEDVALWGVVMVASTLAGKEVSTAGAQHAGAIAAHLAVNIAFVIAALTVIPIAVRKLSQARWNVVARNVPIAWMLAVLFVYVSIAASVDIALPFAALLAGIGVMGGVRGTEQPRFRLPLQSISDLTGQFFAPVYFAIIGYRLDLSTTFDLGMIALFLIGTSTIVFLSVSLGAALAGMTLLDMVNLSITQNARGGPGIIMASVAFDAGIINAPFFTTLVLTAVLTSQACGVWLDYVLRKGWPLLSGADLRRRGIEPESADLSKPLVEATAGDLRTPRHAASLQCGGRTLSNRLYAFQWGERVRMRGGDGRRGHVTPPA